MALADLAKFDPSKPVSLRDISLRQGISLVYLEQLFLKLKKNKIVNSIRGNKGGYILNRNASEIKISEVFLAVEENVKTVGCDKHSKKGCNGKSIKCVTHDLWYDLEIHINNFFEKNTLKDILNKSKKIDRNN